MNICTLVGRLTRDPELRYTPNTNQAVTTFTLAVDKGLSKDKRREMEARNIPTADFISVVAWGKTAENINNFVKKGMMVGVSGRIQSRSYEAKDGSKRYITEVVAGTVEFLERKERNSSQDDTYSDDMYFIDDDMPSYDLDSDSDFKEASSEDIPF